MTLKVGIPQALLYYYYYPAWQEFFQQMGLEVVSSPVTNKKVIKEGVKRGVDDLCLPFKVYYGHVLELINKVDYLFIPRLISLGKNNKVCPKFMGLPDMVRATIPQLPPLLEPVINLQKGILSWRKIAHELGHKLGIKYTKVEFAFWQAFKKQKEFEDILQEGYTSKEAIELFQKKKKLETNKNPVTKASKQIKVLILGHSYIINDHHLSMGLIDLLRDMGVTVITPEMLAKKQLEKGAQHQGKKLFWLYNRHIMGAAYYAFYDAQDNIPGLIQVTAFGCGPDSMIKELIDIRGKKHKDIAVLNINIDEHSGQAGLITRLEAFIDLLKRKEMA